MKSEKKKRYWLWNALLIFTIIACLFAFAAHYRNWTKIEADQIKILSGPYYKKLKYTELDSIEMIAKIPPMKRLNGFSALKKEKGLFREFKDSLTDKKVLVYVDNLSNPKIKVVYNDSSKLYINYKDSMETKRLFELLKSKLEITGSGISN